jgi:Family of unknown function (DUF5681)
MDQPDQPKTAKNPAPAAQARRKPPTPASWKPGQSGNPKGRPRKGNALTEAIREAADPEELAAIALRLAREGESETTVLQALCWLRDSGYTRPADRLEVGPPGTLADDDPIDYDALSLEQIEELEALESEHARRVASVLEQPQRVIVPLITVGGNDTLPKTVALTSHDASRQLTGDTDEETP